MRDKETKIRIKGLLFYSYIFLAFIGLYALPVIKDLFADTNYPPLKPLVRYPYLIIFTVLFILFIFLLQEIKQLKFLSIKKIVIISTVLGLLLVLIGPIFSIDFNNYIMHGRILNIYKQNPYYVAPEQFPTDPFVKGLFWTWATELYGPIWVILSSAFTFFAKNSIFLNHLSLKLLMFLSYIGLLWQGSKLDIEEYRNNKRYLCFFFAFNPYILLQFLVDAHNDILMVFFVILSLYLLTQKNRMVLSGVFFSFAVLVKYVPLMILPIIILYIISKADFINGLKRAFIYAVTVSALSVIMFMPFFKDWDVFKAILNQKCSMGLFDNTLPYALSAILGCADPSHPPVWIMNIFHACFLSSYIGIGLLFWRSRKALEDIGTASFLILMAYLIFESFQLEQWYLIWLLPFLLISRLKGKAFLALGLSIAGTIGFYKRISLLMIMVFIVYTFYYLSSQYGKRNQKQPV